MAKAFFIAGTDTDVGKTFVAEQLVKALSRAGHRTIGFKPIAAGAVQGPQGLRNDDAVSLQAASDGNPDYELINPICFEPAIAPHIAAALSGQPITLQALHRWWQTRPDDYDVEIVEGAGGWRLPVNAVETLDSFVVTEQLPVILVVGMKLGCLNHAMLTVEAIRHAGVPLAGWVANQPGAQMDYHAENLAYLKQQIPAPLLAEIPVIAQGETLPDSSFDLSPLIS